MPEAVILFIKYYFLLALTLFLCYLVGYFVFKLIRSKHILIKGFYSSLFVRLLCGLTAMIAVYSIVRSAGQTINMGLVLIISFLVIEFIFLKKNKNLPLELSILPENETETNRGNITGKLLPLFIVSFILYSWFASIVLTGSDWVFSIPNKDNIFYSNISLMLTQTGIENTCGINNLINDAYSGINPYHYFELWLNAGLSVVYCSPNLLSLYLLTYPMLNIIAVLGLFALLEKISTVSLFQQMAVPLFLFLGGLYFYLEKPSSVYVLNYIEAPLEYFGEKFSAYYPFLFLSVLLFINGYITIALASLLILPILSISVGMGTLGGILLFSLTAVLTRQINKYEFIRICFYVFCLGGFIIFMYTYFGNTKLRYHEYGNVMETTDLTGWSFRSVKIFIAELLYRMKDIFYRSLLLYLPFILLSTILLFSKGVKSHYKNLSWLMLCCYFASLFGSATFYKMQNGWQLYTNVLCFVNVLFIVLALVFFFEKKSLTPLNKKIRSAILAITLIVLFSKAVYAYHIYDVQKEKNNSLSAEYLEKIRRITFKEEEKAIGVMLFEETEYKTLAIKGYPDHSFYLPFLSQYMGCIDISILGDTLVRELRDNIPMIEKKSIEISAFNQFVKSQQEKNNFVSIQQSQIDFIDQYNIKFIIASKNVLINQLIIERVDTLFSDPRSGQRFLLLGN